MQSQVKDFLYYYLPQDTQDFQTYITSKYEFRQLASDVREPVPKRGERYTHQELILRFMKAYDRLLMMHDTGTGKTCASYGPAEAFREEWLGSSIDYVQTYLNGQPGNIKRVVIFTKSKTLRDEFKRQLVCKCTTYETYEQKIERAKPGMGTKRAIFNNLDVFYTFEKYRSFGNWFAKRGTENIEITLRDKYENTLFICDEIQDLITASWDLPQAKKDKDKSAYNALHTLFHVVPNIKVILMSATPMIDQANEIIPIMNLLLPYEMQIPDHVNMDTVTLQELEPYFRGKVSFVRALDTGAVPEYQGENIGGHYVSKVHKIPTIPGSIQALKYQEVNMDRDSYESRSRQASLFVFPDGSTGKEGMSTYLEDDGRGWYRWKNEGILQQQGKPPLASAIISIDALRQFSAKYAAMIELMISLPGNHFAYFDFVTVGTNLFGMLLERFGFERFTGEESAFVQRTSTGKTKFCSASSEAGNVKAGFVKKARYAVITGTTTGTDNILELMNSPLNIDGEYLKVLLVSQVGRTGINVSNVRTGHLAGPSWNQSNTYQALSRFLRATSHVDLVEREALRLNKPISEIKIPVRIYQHCLVDNTTGDTVDIHLYKKSEDKDRSIRRIFRFLKQCAIDCHIHHKRNVRSTDENYSTVCDYQECDYVCVDPEPNFTDYSSYNTIYASAEVKKIQEAIRDVFRTTTVIKHGELVTRLMEKFRHDRSEMEFLANKAVRQLIDRRTVLNDRYGFRSYLQEDGSNLYIQRDYPTAVKDVSLSMYSSNIIGIETTSLDTLVREAASIIPEDVTNRINEITDIDTMYFYLRSLPLDTQIAILENALIERCINGNTPRHIELIIRVYILNIYWFNEPVAEIERQRLSIAGKKLEKAVKRGTAITKKKTVQVQLPEVGNIVYIHTLRSRETGGVLYAATAAASKLLGRLRIMNAEQGYFRDVEPYEIEIYISRIQGVKQQRLARFQSYSIYGSYDINTGEFRIIDNRREISDDKRKRYRGKVCGTWAKNDLIDVAVEVEADIPSVANVTQQQMEEYLEIIGIDTMTLTPQQIPYYYAYNLMGTSVSGICSYVFDKLSRTNRLAFE